MTSTNNINHALDDAMVAYGINGEMPRPENYIDLMPDGEHRQYSSIQEIWP